MESVEKATIKIGGASRMILSANANRKNVGITIDIAGEHQLYFAATHKEMKKIYDFINSEVFGPTTPVAQKHYDIETAKLNDEADKMLRNMDL